MTINIKVKPIKAIFLIILVIGLPLFLAIYKQLFLAYYQETIADKWATYIIVPLFLISIVSLIAGKYKIYRKSETKQVWQTLKSTLLEVLVVFILFLFILRPVVSGTIIIINANIGRQTEQIVEGTIISKKDYHSSRSYEYKLSIKTDSEILIFDTDTKAIVSHLKGDHFRELMTKGSLGLLYKK